MEEEYEIREDDLKMLSEAMIEAKESFENYFQERGIDGAYFDIVMEGFVLDIDFNKWKSIKIERVELDDDKLDEDVVM